MRTVGLGLAWILASITTAGVTIAYVAVAVAAVTPLAGGTGQAAMPPQPNILFIFADDWGRYASAYAALDPPPSLNRHIRTLHLDAVAARGVVFRNAFVPAPSCTPCRSSLLSGRYFFNTGRGAILSGAVWDPSVPSMPLLLQENGYFIGKTGKVWSPGTPADAPIGGQQYAYEKAGMAFQRFSQQAMQAVAAGKSPEQAKQQLYAQVEANFAAFLKERDQQRPFFYIFGPTNTHRPWARGSGKTLWGIDPDKLRGQLPPFLPDVPEVREDVADYLGEVLAFDGMVGTLLRKLQEAGELDRTVIIISGDHGAPGFPRGKCNLYDFGTAVALIIAGPGIAGGRIVDDFVSLMDLAPTCLELGRVKVPSGVAGRSLVPILTCKASGLVDPTRDYVIVGRERHVADARAGNLPYPQRAIRTRDYLYIRNYAPDRWPMGDPKAAADGIPAEDALRTDTFIAFADMDAGPTKAWLVRHGQEQPWRQYYEWAFARRPAEELYDLKADPHQIRNVAGDPKYIDVRQKLAKRLQTLLTAAGDPRIIEAECRFERPPFTDPPPPRKKK